VTKKTEDPSMAKVRSLFDKSGLTLHDLGVKMGAAPEIARQSAFQFLKTKDPHISMLRKFARAMEVELEELTGERKRLKSARTFPSGSAVGSFPAIH
jgi:hypothetical protein